MADEFRYFVATKKLTISDTHTTHDPFAADLAEVT